MVGDKVTMLSFKQCNWQVSFRVKRSRGPSNMVGIKVYRVKRWGVPRLARSSLKALVGGWHGAIQAGTILAGKVVLHNGACKVKLYIGMVGLAGSSMGRW